MPTGKTPARYLIRERYLSNYNAFPSNDNFIRFRLRGNGAAFYLESANKTVPVSNKKIFYYIFISAWNNYKSAILLVNKTWYVNGNLGDHMVTEFIGAQLSTTEFREFWLSWRGHTVKVGKGTEYNKNLIMSWRNPCPFKIVDIAISSEFYCDWEFQSDGKLFLYSYSISVRFMLFMVK